MSHKQAKRDRKLYPHLGGKYRREQERLRREAFIKALHIPAPKTEVEAMPEDKGKLDGACNRSACLERPATWWNESTRAHYCGTCARLINDNTPDGSIICTPVRRPSTMSNRVAFAAACALIAGGKL